MTGNIVLDLLSIVLMTVLILGCLFTDNKFWAGVITIGIILMVGYDNWSAISFNKEFFSKVSTYLAGWLFIGALFSFFKWKMHTLKVASRFNAIVERVSLNAIGDKAVQRRRHDLKIPDNASLLPDQAEILELVRMNAIDTERRRMTDGFNTRFNIVQVEPREPTGWKIDYQKSVLAEYVTSWTVWWPFYAVLLVLDDVIRHVVDWMVTRFGRTYRWIAESSFSDIK